MSQVDQKENLNPATIMTGSAKTAAASPKLSADEHVEMSDLPAGPSEGEDIMQLARVGDILSIQKLFETGKYDAKYSDDEGITPLHWAAINNQYAMCTFLIEQGAEVNKKGGESVATPAMWAAQRCHYYVVHLLLQHGADPLITDVQGYNILHLATFEGNVFLLILLLHQSIPVDTTDSHGHTSLMWASYKGYPACVDLFLRWGADVHATDETGFTALHWGLVKGSLGCIQKLIEYGADRFAETSNGKTPAVTAEEMQTVRVWQKALKECGYAEDGMPATITIPLVSSLMQDKRGFMTKFFFLWPFVIIWVMVMISSQMVVYAGIPMALFWGFALQWVAQRVAEYAPSDMRQLHKTPWLAGIFAGTLFWVQLQYITHILPVTFSSYMFSNIAFIVSCSLCTFFYFTTMLYEPGFVPKIGGLSEQKAAIYDLISLWKFDDQNFCVPCMVRMPLRSKHCKKCQRCVAKHDHHCPWVYNCIGINNHRHFFLYLVSLAIGLGTLVRLTVGYFDIISPKASGECNVFGESLCRVVNADSYTLVLVGWGALQLTWVTMLLFVQLVQVSRAMTTYENMMGAHHGNDSKTAEAITSALTTGTTSRAEAQLGPNGLGPNPALPLSDGHGHHHRQGCFAQWKKILGVDTFVETAIHGSSGTRNRSRRARNPFSAGCVQNCKDFWCDPSPVFGRRENGEAVLGGAVVNYTMMYENPRVMNMRASAGDTAGMYHSVAADDSV